MSTLTTCTSSTRPASPAAGDTLFETDTNKIITYDGTDWRLYASDGSITPDAGELYYDNNAAGFTDNSKDWYLGAGIQPEVHFAADMMSGTSHADPAGGSGSSVADWGDISGNGNDLSQGTAGSQPMWINSANTGPLFRRQTGVLFASDWMALDSVVSLSGAYTYMFVGYKGGGGTSGTDFCGLGTASTWLFLNYRTPDNRSGLDSGAYVDSTYGPNYYATQMFAVTRDGSNNGVSYARGGNSIDTTSVTDSRDVTWMGRDYNQYAQGVVYEAILFTSILSTANLNIIRDYFSAKYDLTTTAFS